MYNSKKIDRLSTKSLLQPHSNQSQLKAFNEIRILFSYNQRAFRAIHHCLTIEMWKIKITHIRNGFFFFNSIINNSCILMDFIFN